jgi:hypothetical protein
MKKLLLILALSILSLTFISSQQLIYDYCNDSSVNTTNWNYTGTASVSEDTTLHIEASGVGVHNGTIKSILLPTSLNSIENLTLNTSMYVDGGTDGTAPLEWGNATIFIFGNMIKSIQQIGSDTQETDKSFYIVRRNSTVSAFTYEVYDDGTWLKQITMKNNLIELNVTQNQISSPASARINISNVRYFYTPSTIVFNETTYETSSESFYTNTTTLVAPTIAYLEYNGTNYSTTITNLGSNIYSFTGTLDIPQISGAVNLKFIWYNGTYNSNSIHSQYVYQTIFGLCNSTLTNRFINFSFKDEADSSSISASIPSSTFNYYLGTGTQNKTLSFINSTANPSYAFCFNQIDKNISVTINMQYKNTTNYPQRSYYSNLFLTNITTNKTLYLLSTTDGLYVTYQVLDSTGGQLSGVTVLALREVSGENITVGCGTTDSAGIVTFWMNPDFQHIVTFTKTGYLTYTYTHYPTQSSYTIQMTSGSSATDINDYIRGIKYKIEPEFSSFLNSSRLYNFNLTFNSSYWDLDSFGYNIFGDEVLIASNSSTSSTGGFLSSRLNISTYQHLSMNYYWIVNGTVINATNRGWFVFDYGNGTSWSIANFFSDLSTYASSGDGLFGLDEDDLNFVIFLSIFIVVGVCSYKFPITSPEVIMGIIFGLVFIFDVGLGLINVEPIGAIQHFPTLATLIVTIGFIIMEMTR